MAATAKELAAVEQHRASREQELAARRGEFEELAKQLAGLEVAIPADAGEGGRLFGSITSQDIALAVKNVAQIDLDKKKIELSEPIKVLGEYSVPVKIFQDIGADLKVKVVAR